MVKLLGYCKECFNEIIDIDEIDNDNIYECPKCYYPNAIVDMHDLQVPIDYRSK